jgi:hypothetical protein
LPAGADPSFLHPTRSTTNASAPTRAPITCRGVLPRR